MPLLVSIRGLRTFCIAAQSLSFKKAATQLHLTPSAVSHQVKQLEEHLKIHLFERQTRALSLTQRGHQFYKAIFPIILQLESTITEFTHEPENITITISMPEFFASELFVPRLSEWTELHPEINLQLETIKPKQTSSKSCDLSILLSNDAPSAQVVYELFALRYLPACNPAIYKQWQKRSYAALNALPLIVHQARPWVWHQWAEAVALENFKPKQIIELDSMFSIARAAQNGMGIAMVPMPITAAWFKNNLLVNLYRKELVTNDRYFLVQHENARSQQALNVFVEWFKATYRNIE